jgi:hypothetical protein
MSLKNVLRVINIVYLFYLGSGFDWEFFAKNDS